MTGPRPNLWKSGPDVTEHKKYRSWLQQRNQAQWRGEPWELTLDEWKAVWGDNFHRKGRASDSLCMTRRDRTLPWRTDNVMLMTRKEHTLSQDQYREPNWRCGPRKPYRKKVST